MPKLTILRKIFLVIINLLLILLLTGCGDNKTEDELKMEKVEQEMSYLDNKIIDIMNKLNNISFSNYKVVSEDIKEEKKESLGENSSDKESENSEKSDDEKIFKLVPDVLLLGENEQNEEVDWGEIRRDIENIYTIWPTISIDLESVGVNTNETRKFNLVLDDIATDVKDKKQNLALIDLSKLYNLIPNYMNYYIDEELNKDIINIKSHILNSYVLINNENWEGAKKELKYGEDIYRNLKANSKDYENKEINLNRSNLLLSDLKQSIEKKDKQIFYVRYKNLLEELNVVRKN